MLNLQQILETLNSPALCHLFPSVTADKNHKVGNLRKSTESRHFALACFGCTLLPLLIAIFLVLKNVNFWQSEMPIQSLMVEDKSECQAVQVFQALHRVNQWAQVHSMRAARTPQGGARRRPNAARAIDPSMEQVPSAEASEPRRSATSANSSRNHSMVGRSSKFSRPRPSDLPHFLLQLSSCHAVTGALKSRNTSATVVVVLLCSSPKKQRCNLCHSSMSTDGAKLVKFSSSIHRSALVRSRVLQVCCPGKLTEQ